MLAILKECCPFLVQEFIVESLDDIDLLAQFCEHVWVDQKIDHLSASARTMSNHRKGSVTPTIYKIPTKAAIDQSRQLHRSATETAQGILKGLRLGKELDAQSAKITVNACVKNVVADAGVALLVQKMQERQDSLLDHALNVCVLAISLGKFLGLLEGELHNLGICALLHDVGEVKLPKEVLESQGVFSDEQFELFQQHTIYGRNILSSAKNLYHGAVDVAYSHHEQMDGEGYPRQLKASGISQFARIVGICDSYETLISSLANHRALPSTLALKQLLAGRGSLYDGDLVDQFQEMIGLYPPGTIVELLNGCVGIVMAKNYRYQDLPRIIIVLDEKKEKTKQRVVDLAKTMRGQLDNAYLVHNACIDGAYGIYLRDYREQGFVIQNY